MRSRRNCTSQDRISVHSGLWLEHGTGCMWQEKEELNVNLNCIVRPFLQKEEDERKWKDLWGKAGITTSPRKRLLEVKSKH